jgi:hypothetical protein
MAEVMRLAIILFWGIGYRKLMSATILLKLDKIESMYLNTIYLWSAMKGRKGVIKSCNDARGGAQRQLCGENNRRTKLLNKEMELILRERTCIGRGRSSKGRR